MSCEIPCVSFNLERFTFAHCIACHDVNVDAMGCECELFIEMKSRFQENDLGQYFWAERSSRD